MLGLCLASPFRQESPDDSVSGSCLRNALHFTQELAVGTYWCGIMKGLRFRFEEHCLCVRIKACIEFGIPPVVPDAKKKQFSFTDVSFFSLVHWIQI